MVFISNKRWENLQLQIKALQTTNLLETVNNFSTRIFPNWGVVKEMDAYQTLDQIYCVVKKLATCSAMIPFYGFDKAKDTDLPETDNLNTFLKGLDYEEKEKLYIYLYLGGEVFAYKNRTESGVNAGMVYNLVFLHPGKVTPFISQFPYQIAGYRYFEVESGFELDIPLEDMIYIKTFNPSSIIGEQARGLSIIKVLTRVIAQIRSSDDVTVAQLQNGGVPGIVYNKLPGASTEAIGQRKDAFGRFLKNSSNKGAPYFAGDELGYIELGTPLTDMEIVALAETSFDRICNVLGVSSILFNNKSASTESNVQEMVKEMYTNTIIPNVYRVEAALNKGLLNVAMPDIKTKGIIKCDVSDIKALQEDQAKLVSALAAAWWLTGNEKRTAQMYDQDTENELMDKYLIPSGMVVLDDLDMVIDEVENTANDYQLDANGKPLPQANVVPLKTGTNG